MIRPPPRSPLFPSPPLSRPRPPAARRPARRCRRSARAGRRRRPPRPRWLRRPSIPGPHAPPAPPVPAGTAFHETAATRRSAARRRPCPLRGASAFVRAATSCLRHLDREFGDCPGQPVFIASLDEVHVAAGPLHRLPGDVQTETGPAPGGFRREARLEEPPDVVGSDSRPFVADPHLERLLQQPPRDAAGARGPPDPNGSTCQEVYHRVG